VCRLRSACASRLLVHRPRTLEEVHKNMKSDLMDALGPVEGAAILRQRGRWKGNLGTIYARLSAVRQLDASRRMSASQGIDMTARAGWAQPTHVGR